MLKRKLFSIITFCILIPLTVIAGVFLFRGGQYYVLSLIIAVISVFPFLFSLERKKLQVRELVITASVIAIAVASRAAFFFLPQVKPVCALLIISACAFGAEFGFVTGAMAMLISNFIYGQGIWTPFQMIGMALTAFICALIFRTFKIRNRFVIGLISGALCFVVYGIIVDFGSAFMMLSELNIKTLSTVFISGIPFNAIHAISTAIIVILIQPEINEKLERIKTKYGLFDEKKNKDITGVLN